MGFNKNHINESILSFNGIVTAKVISNLKAEMEAYLISNNLPITIQKKLLIIAIECLQNIFHHSEKLIDLEKESFVLTKSSNYYCIETTNAVKATDIERLVGLFDNVCSMSELDLKNEYTEKLNNNKFSNKGGAGLGLLEIARKSKQNLEYSLEEYKQEVQLFRLKVKIEN